MADMGKKAMHESFRQMLDDRKQLLKVAAEKKKEMSAAELYGQICGVADSMWKIGLIDYDQAEYIKNEAENIRLGKEPEYEPC